MLSALAILLSTATAACPDLSGRYAIPTEDGSVSVVIQQTRCDSVSIQWNIHYNSDSTPTRHLLELSGRFQSDPGWFGDSRAQLTSASFIGDTLVLVARAAPGAPSAPAFSRAAFRAINGGICTRFIGPGNGDGWSFAARIRPGHLITEDERDDGDVRCRRLGR
jgi:hypothetical protein